MLKKPVNPASQIKSQRASILRMERKLEVQRKRLIAAEQARDEAVSRLTRVDALLGASSSESRKLAKQTESLEALLARLGFVVTSWQGDAGQLRPLLRFTPAPAPTGTPGATRC